MKIRFTRFSMILLTNTDTGNTKINILNIPVFLLSQVHPLVKLSWRYVRPFPRNVANRHGLPQTSKQISVFKGLNGTSWKCSRLFLVPSPTFPENRMKIHSAVFPWCCHHTDVQTNQHRWNHNPRRSAEVITVKLNAPQVNFDHFPCRSSPFFLMFSGSLGHSKYALLSLRYCTLPHCEEAGEQTIELSVIWDAVTLWLDSIVFPQ